MTTTLRVVLDQLAAPTDPTLAAASRELARALVATAPSGCDVEAILPAVPEDRLAEIRGALPGIAEISRLSLARRELAAAVQLGIASGMGSGLVHSPTLFAPLVRHDRVHDHDQIVVTVWDLAPWETPADLPRSTVAWHKAMLKRAVKHADAVVVPTHSIGDRLAEIGSFGDRVRVIAGAAPAGMTVPSDEVGRRRALGLPDGVVVLAGGAAASHGLDVGFAALARARVDLPVVVLDAGEGEEPAIVELASAAGIPESHVHVRGDLDDLDRASVFGGAVAFVAPSERPVFPWRVVDALTLGVPIVAADSPSHRETIADGGLLANADADALGQALANALSSTAAAERLAVLAADRGRSFSWQAAADRTWQLHAEL